MNSPLLNNIYYGFETNRLTHSLAKLAPIISGCVNQNYKIPVERLANDINLFFGRPYDGVFGGQITAGDGAFIYTMMDAVRPVRMIEFGVASGYSSALILHCAQTLGLLNKEPYLTSFDIDDGRLSGNEVGSFVSNYYPEFIPHWCFHPGQTSLDIMQTPSLIPFTDAETHNILAFIDAGHNHPWPAVDLLSLYCILNATRADNGVDKSDVWVMLQDVRMMERWIMDCIRFAVPCPAPIRGVELAYSLWPGKKFIGLDICYNMAAINLNISTGELLDYFQELSIYNFECNFDREIFTALITKIVTASKNVGKSNITP